MQNDYLWSLLAHDEKTRANCFYYERHRLRFIIARGTLRYLAGQLLNQAPATLRFSYTRHGKPAFRDYPQIHFNLSHSRDRAVYAFALEAPVGVDIEYQNPQRNIEGIAHRFFTRREYAALQELQGVEKRAAFFKLWVGKEAVLKASGHGLSGALSEVEFDLEKNSTHLSMSCNRMLNPAEWSLYALDLEQDFAAALAIQSHPRHIEVQPIDVSVRFSSL